MTTENMTERHLELLKALDEETIQTIFKIMGKEKFSIKPIINHFKKARIVFAFNNTNKSIEKIAEENGVSRHTAYRTIKLKNIYCPPAKETT